MVAELRRNAIDLARAYDWAGIFALRDELRSDQEQWVNVWAPLIAVAARNLGEVSARSYLDEAVAAGFFQPSIHEPQLSMAFASEPDWAQLQAAMAANTPGAPLELLEWPTIRPTAPLELFRTDDEAQLRARVPVEPSDAWETAKALLSWATHAWEHTSNDHLIGASALEILDEVARGRRFACKEYTVVLTQTLNAFGIPARRVALLNATHHAGVGTGHEVSEAWIDNLNKWVVLDGQNGLYWVSADGVPLGVVELQELYRSGTRAETVGLRKSFDDSELDLWWTYFAFAFVTGVMWPSQRMVPFFEGHAVRLPAMVASPEHAYPDLSEIALSFTVEAEKPALQVHPAHPFATGYRVDDVDYSLSEPWAFPDRGTGTHSVQLSTLTPYGPTHPATITWKTA